MGECQSYIRQSLTCRDGFIQTIHCWKGVEAGCKSCDWSRSVPHCLKDNLPSHFIKDDGVPLFYKEAPQ